MRHRQRHDRLRHPLERPPAVYLDEDDPDHSPEERRDDVRDDGGDQGGAPAGPVQSE
jgi:hypothetical protein